MMEIKEPGLASVNLITPPAVSVTIGGSLPRLMAAVRMRISASIGRAQMVSSVRALPRTRKRRTGREFSAELTQQFWSTSKDRFDEHPGTRTAATSRLLGRPLPEVAESCRLGVVLRCRSTE